MSTLAPPAGAAPRSLTAGGVFVLGLAALDFGLEQSMLVPALPQLAEAYGASLIAVGWLATAYLLTGIVSVPLLGRLGDLVGKRRMILGSLSAFVAGSLVCAVTHSIAVAIVGRGIQGFGAAIAPLTYGLVRDTIDKRNISHTIGALIGIANIGGGVGFLLGGLIVDAFSPTAIFWFLFGFGLAVFACVVLFVQESPVRTAVEFDPLGTTLLSVGLVSLLLGISKGSAWGWSSPALRSLFVVAASALVAFAVVEGRVRAPLVDLRLVSRKPFLNTNICILTFGFAFFTATLTLPLIGSGLGMTTTGIGLVLAATSLAILAAAWLGGRFVDRVGARLLATTGAFFGIAGYCLLATWHSSPLALGVGTAVVVVGSGLIPTAVLSVVLRNAGSGASAVAPAVTLLFRSVGLAVGATVSFAVISAGGGAGYTRAFLVAGGGTGLAVLTSLSLPGRPR
jgi:MFS family permease